MNNSPPAKAVDACKSMYGAIQKKYADCGTGLESVFTQTLIDNQCNLIATYSDAGTLKYDTTHYTACKSAIEMATCTFDDPNLSLECGQVFTGVRAGGETCKTSLECSSSSCNLTSVTGGQVCPGTCKTSLDIGGDCAMANSVCKAPYGCTSDTKKCVALATAGQSCRTISCQSNLFCDSTMVCKAHLEVGADCTNATNGCGSFFSVRCKNNVCTALRKVGESCTVANGSSDCVLAAYCESGSCKKWPSLGGTCGVVNNQTISCVDSYCPSTTTTATCTALIAEGGTCTGNNQCVFNTTCTGATGSMTCKKQECN